MKKLFTIFLFLIFTSTNINATSSISGKRIEEILSSWLNAQGQEANLNILSTIKYPYCDNSNLLLSDISGTYNLIKISCLAPNEWSFIARNKKKRGSLVNNSKKKHEIKIITLKNTKSAGSTITDRDLVTIKKRVKKMDGLVLTKNEIVGRKLKSSTSSGKPLYYGNFEKKWLIEKNSTIIIENKIGSITIKEEGIALEDADYMGKIKVKNIKSGKIILGFAVNEKKVVLKTKQF